MIKFHIDIATERRLTGWVYNSDDMRPAVTLSLQSDGMERQIPLIPRPDVAAAFNLESDLVGFDIGVPDCFDGRVSDYILFAEGARLFSFAEGLGSVEFAVSKNIYGSGESLDLFEAVEPENYGVGRHVIFIHEPGDSLAQRLSLLRTAGCRKFFPSVISGCRFSSVPINVLEKQKALIVPRLSEIIIVCPSNLSDVLFRTSPSLFGARNLVTLYDGPALESELGIHEFQLNNFISSKYSSRFSDPWLRCLGAIWAAVENYSDLLFTKMERTYFMATEESIADSTIIDYVQRKIQGVRNEDVIKVIRADTSVTLLNFSAYVRLFDCIGDKDCWSHAVRRGLSHRIVEL